MKTSKDPRHQSRRLAVGIVYSHENSTDKSHLDNNEELISLVIENLGINNYDKPLLNSLLNSLSKNIETYRKLVRTNAIGWDVEKLYKMDLSILLVATSELNLKFTPTKVVIDEAVELAKEFGTNDSPKFINGILGGIAKVE